MRSSRFSWLVIAGLASTGAPLAAEAQDVLASPPVDVSVTVYRDPYRDEGGFDLDYLGGFALITETRRVLLTPGDHRLRFEGVADGIEPASAIVTGLPSGVIEKNRDAMLLSPSALIAAAAEQDGRVALTRTDPATGVTTRKTGTIRSGADGGVVFEGPEGIEGLRCSGLPETFSFDSAISGLSALPTLSVRTRVNEPVEALVQLSYLSRGFDWAADYVADRSSGGEIALGGWITLANGNSVSFPNARVQVVAGKLNRESGEVEPIDFGQPIFAQCWPRGSTSDYEPSLYISKAIPVAAMAYESRDRVVVVTGFMRQESVEDSATGVTAVQEDLGDLKLYRMPERSTLLSRQAKQVRLLDRAEIPVERIYESDFGANDNVDYTPMQLLLRTQNDEEHNLGLPLPSGRVQMFEVVGQAPDQQRLLAGETTLRDITLDEETEFEFNGGADIQVRQIVETRQASRLQAPLPVLPLIALLPQINAGSRRIDAINRIEISNARPYPVQVELRLWLNDGGQMVRASHAFGQKNGRPIFRLTVPANDTLEVRYQTSTRTR
ncbi:MAG: hypothetical protein B7Y90_07655 [Alphaproteobacteria bacterium 32-64-14]|nr:MAG: hypothetical protein B7Y90_07655 [Alphaproteobacteria bacterium 32-64-14]